MILNEALLEEARRLTGLTEKTALVHAGSGGADRAREREPSGGPGGHRSGRDGRPQASSHSAPRTLLMVLVDTSVWVNHFRVINLPLVRLLKDAKVIVHPFVVGELACGRLARRHEVLGSAR